MDAQLVLVESKKTYKVTLNSLSFKRTGDQQETICLALR
jgi:hypothetical protein